MTNTSTLDDFDIKLLGGRALVAVVGPRGTGTITVQKNLFQQCGLKQSVAYIPVAPPTLFTDVVPAANVHTELKEALTKIGALLHGEEGVCWLLASLASHMSSMQSVALQKLILDSVKRNSCLTILNEGYLMDIPKMVRDSVDWWFIRVCTATDAHPIIKRYANALGINALTFQEMITKSQLDDAFLVINPKEGKFWKYRCSHGL